MTVAKRTGPVIGRRGFLAGLYGAVVGLPVLESLAPRTAHAQTPPPRGFAVFVRSANGVAQAVGTDPERFWPNVAAGPITQASLGTQSADRAISELAAYAPKLNILKGVNRPYETPSCGHAESTPQVLTAVPCTPGTGNTPLALGESIDWRIARAINPTGREPLTVWAGPSNPYYREALSWRSARVREPAQRSPRAAYTALMGLGSMPTEVQQQIARGRTSVNDLIREETRALLAASYLGALDRARLQQHLEAIRDTEIQLAACSTDATTAAQIQAITNPEANDVRPDVVRRHMDVIALAFSCGTTRVATLQIGEGNDKTEYIINGTRLPYFHWISHRMNSDGPGGSPIANAQYLHHQIDRLQLQLYKYLLDRLSAYASPNGTGTLLDASCAVWMNDIGDGPSHSGRNVPWILAGGANGALRTGNYLNLGGVRYNTVLNTVASAVGVRKSDGTVLDDFGDPSLPRGVITQILAAR